ncbi:MULTISPECIES: GNAT family N-acetyltransferase [Pacificibacter]|uniref:GNAT family N-acetyltransferase n=1 Tax=Pacificibacter TaxID=1042323 RepID=UPI001C087929|nr:MULTISPECIES: GNAT family N-acetyltransferase [Pacificibacter]MBU2937309.1 GNAT family N-acetyltransferase [Pacificibacter marinus]MDO6615304.1 GNAT family N-acetyltransferase [Pacificibacter sp. 1_MG-2023]
MSDQIEIFVSGSMAEFDPSDWDACAVRRTQGSRQPLDPFTTHRFLTALEESGSVGASTGWAPRYLGARQNGQLIAVAPLYAKGHSQGEYVFDHAWAQAYENAGGHYYPKLQVAVPFTPATGRRFLCREGYDAIGQTALVQGAVHVASEQNLSSLHITFCTEDEARTGREMGLLHRIGQQFHWENNGYADFDVFLSDLSARKRKAIRKERKQAQGFGGEILSLTGDAIQAEHWDAFWQFYQNTGARKWGTPYLTRAFFDCVQETMRDDVLLVLAMRDGVAIAGALNFIGGDTLFGRYWGCTEHHACLHFELCYYQAIDYAITHELARVEAGAQGEHKLARGYLPKTTHSLHWIADAGFARAVQDYVDAEREAVDQDTEVLTSYGPFRRTNTEDDHD